MKTKMDTAQLGALYRVLQEVAVERERQHAKWGEQNHPDGLDCDAALRIPGADHLRADCERAFAEGRGTYAHIALEEVAEAIDADNVDDLRKELLQCAAVFVAWVEKLDRDAAKRGR